MKRWTLLEKTFFAAFLFWSACGLIFTLAKIHPENVEVWNMPAFLRDFVLLCLRAGDPLLILLAFANTHLHAARQWSPALARRWALIILGAAFTVETIGVRTGLPFGAYRYTHGFGPMLGLVPFVIPFAWHVVVTNALFLARRLAPNASRPVLSLIVGAICTAYDSVLEPFATHAKHYWNWTGGRVPLQNYVAWFVISALLAGLFAPRPEKIHAPGDPRPSIILAVMLLIFLAGSWRG